MAIDVDLEPQSETSGNGAETGEVSPAGLRLLPWDRVRRVCLLTLARVLAVVGAGMAVAWMAGYVPNLVLTWLAVALGALVLVVWHLCRLDPGEHLRVVNVALGLALVVGVFVVLRHRPRTRSA